MINKEYAIASGGKRKGVGRPRSSDDVRRDIRRMYRFNAIEVEIIDAAVKVSGKKESEFVRDAIISEAKKKLKKK